MAFDKLTEEKDKVFETIACLDPASEDYHKVLEAYETLAKLEKDERQEEFIVETKSKELDFREKEAFREYEARMAEVDQKNKESKRGLIGKIVMAVFALAGTLFTIFAEETRIMGSKAWQTLNRYPRN